MTEFLLNNKLIRTGLPKGTVLLDFIRNEERLKGTKSACREGDCGSCTVLVGALEKDAVNYHAVTSCITPLGNMHGKHVVTIEGLNSDELSPIQQALVNSAAVQCGYCTPGIVLSLTAYVLTAKAYSFESAKDAVAGNICRCTGYKSIEKALELINSQLNLKKVNGDLGELIARKYIPEYFGLVKDTLKTINPYDANQSDNQIIGGGTDLYVQRPDEMIDIEPCLVTANSLFTSIFMQDNQIKIGAACRVSDLLEQEAMHNSLPGFKKFIELIASTLIRNIATVAGNFVNASPIGDLSIFFLALDASLEIATAEKEIRNVKLKDFFKDYKIVDLKKGEPVRSVNFDLPGEGEKFNFEKVSKRKYLDIASVNSAILIKTEDSYIKKANLSIGGVAPIPLYLKDTSEFLLGKEINEKTINEAIAVLNKEISPISDVRGSAEYKRLLAMQLFYAHFLELYPEIFKHFELRN